MITHPTLYKRDTAGRVRIWFMERDGAMHRVVSGLQDGQQTRSIWTTCTPKSQDTAEEQAEFEVEALYRHQLDREYHETIDTIDQPKFFKPMLAQKFEGWTPGCFSQPKLDGIRCITTKDGMFSREGKPIFGAPHIQAALAALFREHPHAVLDGELYNHDLKDDFNTIVSAVKKQKPSADDLLKSEQLVQYHVYDFPSQGSLDFLTRFQLLSNLMHQFTVPQGAIRLVATTAAESTEQLDRTYAVYLEAGYEGQMVRLNAPYAQKRSKALLKRKEFQDAEFAVVRIEEGLGNWSGVAKRVVCLLPDGREFGAGIKGDRTRAAELLHETHKVVTIKFFAYTPDGVPRFPVAVKFWGEERSL